MSSPSSPSGPSGPFAPFAPSAPSAPSPPGSARRLWALDGPRLTMDRAELLDGAEPGPVRLVVPAFLVEHDDGLLLLDAGLDPRAASDADGAVATFGDIGHRIEYAPRQRVDRQIEALGFATADVTHVVLSHAHFDHTGGLRLFPDATFLVGTGDRPSVRGEEDEIARPEDLAPARDFTWTFLDGDHDVFGDGAVVVLAMPGHTPGNTSLLVRLPRRTILLTADTAHLRGALRTGAPMSADTDKAAAARSLARLGEVAAREGAEVWVGHDPDDWERFGAPGPVDGATSRG